MIRIHQSFAWWCFANQQVQPEKLLRAAADLGYEAVDLAPREYWQLIQAHGLKIAAIDGHRSIEEGLNRREHHQRIEQELRANIALAQQWGSPHLICFSGSRAGLDDQTGIEIAAEGLRRVSKVAEDAGVTLVLEMLNSKVDHKDYQGDHTAWGVELCRLVDSPNVQLLYDIYHMQIMEGDVIRTIRDYHPYFAHYHTAGNPGRHDLNEEQELYYPAIMRAILATGYQGYISHEFVPEGDPIAALKHAFELCALA
ncbi:MAG: TIM barrel protein [Ktedonobacteraceae bacterium]|nr:TIM barrel protein [Ktedonobacteraceae bacterium]